MHSSNTYLCDNGAGSRALVLPGRGQDTNGLVVARQAVDTRLDENEAELAILVLAVALEVLADGDSLIVYALVPNDIAKEWEIVKNHTFLMSM